MKFTSTEATPAPHVPPGVLRLTGAAKEDIPMYRIQTMNKISPVGLNRFPSELYEVGDAVQDPQGILVRSAKLLDLEFNPSLLAIARAGVGVNNIPLDRCAAAGIPVFSTPGANANAVAELVVCGLMLGGRNVSGGIQWAQTLKGQGDAVPKLVEKGKGQFAGPEVRGKTLGVIGLGAIGVKVANTAVSLGMEVYGYDPYVSVNAAWNLSRSVKHVMNVEEIYADCDYITIHVPLLDSTKGMINKEAISKMKDGVVLLNFARDLLANEADVLEALKSGKVARYVSDFPNPTTAGQPSCIVIPHLGASTEESEDNCAKMAVEEMMDYLENGNIRNSVNYPACDMGVCSQAGRIAIFHKNITNMLNQFTAVIGEKNINISDMTNKSRGEVAYTMLDIENAATQDLVESLQKIDGVFRVRIVK